MSRMMDDAMMARKTEFRIKIQIKDKELSDELKYLINEVGFYFFLAIILLK